MLSQAVIPAGLQDNILHDNLQVGQLACNKQETDPGCDALVQSLPGFIHSLLAHLPGYALQCAGVFRSCPDRLKTLQPLSQVPILCEFLKQFP